VTSSPTVAFAIVGLRRDKLVEFAGAGEEEFEGAVEGAVWVGGDVRDAAGDGGVHAVTVLRRGGGLEGEHGATKLFSSAVRVGQDGSQSGVIGERRLGRQPETNMESVIECAEEFGEPGGADLFENCGVGEHGQRWSDGVVEGWDTGRWILLRQKRCLLSQERYGGLVRRRVFDAGFWTDGSGAGGLILVSFHNFWAKD
jgi:hypothetical protein